MGAGGGGSRAWDQGMQKLALMIDSVVGTLHRKGAAAGMIRRRCAPSPCIEGIDPGAACQCKSLCREQFALCRCTAGLHVLDKTSPVKWLIVIAVA